MFMQDIQNDSSAMNASSSGTSSLRLKEGIFKLFWIANSLTLEASGVLRFFVVKIPTKPLRSIGVVFDDS